MKNNNTMEENFFKRVKSITTESHYEDEKERKIFRNGFNEALGLVHIDLFGTPKTKGFLKEQIELAEQSLVGRVREAILEKKIGDEINTCYCSGYGEHKHCERSADRKIDQILSLPILSITTPDGDNQ